MSSLCEFSSSLTKGQRPVFETQVENPRHPAKVGFWPSSVAHIGPMLHRL